jgi:hypothetical protein
MKKLTVPGECPQFHRRRCEITRNTLTIVGPHSKLLSTIGPVIAADWLLARANTTIDRRDLLDPFVQTRLHSVSAIKDIVRETFAVCSICDMILDVVDNQFGTKSSCPRSASEIEARLIREGAFSFDINYCGRGDGSQGQRNKRKVQHVDGEISVL